MMMKRELHTFIIGSVLFFTACGDKQESEQKSGYRIQGDTVYIADPLLLEKIKVSVSELKPYSKKVITSGVVRPIPPRYAYVAPPSPRFPKDHRNLPRLNSHRPGTSPASH